ncbi:MAG: HAD-IA family hydrolase [Gemmata sp.]
MPVLDSGVRAVFFDAVGTLLFPEPAAPAAYAAVARRHGLDLSAEAVRERFAAAYRREEAADIALQWATSEGRERDRWRAVVAEVLAGVPDVAACFDHLFHHFAQPHAWRVHPDAAGLLPALRARGLVLGMGSNYDARLGSVLAGFPELAPLAGRVLISSQVGVRKPGAAFFRAVADAAGCAPGEVLFVGDDRENDYLGATAAGLRAVLFDPDGRHPQVRHRLERLADLG